MEEVKKNFGLEAIVLNLNLRKHRKQDFLNFVYLDTKRHIFSNYIRHAQILPPLIINICWSSRLYTPS